MNKNKYRVDTVMDAQRFSSATGEPIPRERYHHIYLGDEFVCLMRDFPGSRDLADLAVQAWNYSASRNVFPLYSTVAK